MNVSSDGVDDAACASHEDDTACASHEDGAARFRQEAPAACVAGADGMSRVDADGADAARNTDGARRVLPACLPSTECFVLGYPMAHSLSPALFAGAFEAAGLPFTYAIREEPHADAALHIMHNKQFLLMNVSTPYKALALRAATTVRREAAVAGGANVLIPATQNPRSAHSLAPQLYADNVDGVGCIAFLKSQHAWCRNARVVLCGTGPTAFAIAHMALCEGAASVCLLSRNYQRAHERLSQYLQRVQSCQGMQSNLDIQSHQFAQLMHGEQLSPDAAPANDAAPAPDLTHASANTVISSEITSFATSAASAAAHEAPANAATSTLITPASFTSVPSAATDTAHAASSFVPSATSTAATPEPPRQRCLLKRVPPSFSHLTQALSIDTYNNAAQHLISADIVINASTLGMKPHDASPLQARLLQSQHIVFDVTYAQPTTAFLDAAHAVHARAYNGLGMLVYQALEGFFDMCALHCIPLTVPTDQLLHAMLEKSGIDKSFSRRCERA